MNLSDALLCGLVGGGIIGAAIFGAAGALVGGVMGLIIVYETYCPSDVEPGDEFL